MGFEDYGKTACGRFEMEMDSLVNSFSSKFSLENNTKAEKWIKHYSSKHKILLVGEGDFSFSACLGRSLGSALNMVATSLDSIVDLVLKYDEAMTNVRELEGLGCRVIHEIDCCTMSQHADLEFELFDRIVFNFPHAGLFSETSSSVIEVHKSVVKGFLRNAVEMLRENGEVHVTHKTTYPFREWEIEKLANEAGLRLFEQVPFSVLDYPGYRNKYGAGHKADQSFPVGSCSTFKFKII